MNREIPLTPFPKGGTRIQTAMRQLLGLAMNDVRLTVKDRSAFVWMLLMPVVLMWFFGQVMSGDGKPQPTSLVVADHDGGWLAEALLGELEGDEIALTEAEPAAEGEVPPRKLVLPEGLTEGALAGEQQELVLEIGPDSSSERRMSVQSRLLRTLVKVTGRLLMAQLAAEEDDDVAERYAEVAAEEPWVRLEVTMAGSGDPAAGDPAAGDPVPSGYAQSVPGILTMLVLMMTLIYGGVFLVLEKQQGMLRRQLASPVSRGRLIAGKILGRLLIAALQIVLLLAIGRFAFGLSLGSSPAGLVLVIGGFAFAVAGCSMLLGALCATTEQASMLGWVLSMVLAGLGGCWFPREVMPEWLQTASHVLPTAWAMDGFHGLISYGRGVEGVWLASVVLLGFGVAASALAARVLRADR